MADPVSAAALRLARYDLVQVNACYTTDHEMERSDDGEWVRFEDVEPVFAALARAEQTIRAQHERIDEIRALCVEAGISPETTTLDYIRSAFYQLGKLQREPLRARPATGAPETSPK